MPRRREVPKRPTIPDSKHGDQQLGRFINVIMRDGKKSTAESIVYGAFDEIESELSCKPAGLVDVLLTDLSAVWGDQSDTLDANAFIYPWFRDGSTSCVPWPRLYAYRNTRRPGSSGVRTLMHLKR